MRVGGEAEATRLIAGARDVVVLSGAGISTASGIPDFRGPTGLWTADPLAERISTLSWYLGDQATREAAWRYRAESPVWDALPNAAHRCVASLEEQGKLRVVVTQNTDGLHQLAGLPPAKVLEVHGNVRTVRCEECGAESPTVEAVARVRAGEADPRCEAVLAGPDGEEIECGGILRATTILFEESLNPSVLDAAIEAASVCDLMLAVGSSLGVYPVAGLVPLAKRCGASVVIANATETPYDLIADAVVREPLQECLPRMCSPD